MNYSRTNRFIFQSVVAVALRYYLASEKLMLPLLLTLLSSGNTIGLDMILTGYYGVGGLGYGAAAGAMLNAAGYAFFLHRDLNLRAMLVPFIKMTAANAPPALLVMGIAVLSKPAGGMAFQSPFVFLAGMALIYGTVYLWILKRMKLLEFAWRR
ncbi:hypothetical protein [Ferviditalea candida]|uniref:Polysaccharide biosynthesis protein C-terminal domain-containing protein n=1 Tax=Ferviditalea candida TaxID=3108399 RepID=A0ABU5ZGK1_9BACL|nr:hypothetical protein [Paenibacillaceae bacterium T2]